MLLITTLALSILIQIINPTSNVICFILSDLITEILLNLVKGSIVIQFIYECKGYSLRFGSYS
jgi:hypothetical protein